VNTAAEPQPDLSLVVPTYNEIERLEDFVRTVWRVFETHRLSAELVIVDDNSPDGTGVLADRLAKALRISVVHRAGKLGLGSAVMAGFGVAKGRLLGVMDADLSHPPDLLPVLIAAIEASKVDVVVASRYVPGGGTKNWPWSRAVMSAGACALARVITPVRDAASGFFVLRREVVQDVQIQAAGFKICLELLARGSARSVAEVPYVFADRAAGQSKMSYREALGYLVQLWQLFWWSQRTRRPRLSYRSFSPAEVARLSPEA
jgi:dolichol-phosphate mannosyltransferase